MTMVVVVVVVASYPQKHVHRLRDMQSRITTVRGGIIVGPLENKVIVLGVE